MKKDDRPKTLDNTNVEELLADADKELEAAGIDPNAHPADAEEGADGGLQPDKENGEEAPTGEEEKPKEEEDDKGGEGEEANKDDDKDKDAAAGSSATDESGNKITFANAQELSDFVTKQMETLKDPTTTKEEKKDAEDALTSIKLYDDDQHKPKNWNEAFRDIIKAIRPVLKNMDAEDTKAVTDKVKSVNDEFDKIYDDLATKNSLPKRGTPEGNEVDRQITSVGAAYGIGDYRKAHAIWSKLPKETEITLPGGKTTKVGGLDYKPEKSAETKPEKKPNPSKTVAKLQSPGRSAGTPPSKKTDYSSIHNVSMDKLLEEDL